MIDKIINKYNNISLVTKASFWFLLSSFLQKGISVISTPIFTRLLNTVEYGKYTTFNSWLNIVTVFVSLNLYNGFYMQGLAKNENSIDSFSSSILGLTSTLVLIWTIIYILFINFWNNLLSLTTIQVLSMLGMILASSAFCFWSMKERYYFNYKSVIKLTVIVSIAKPLIGILAVINFSDKVTARIVGLLLVEVVGYLWCYVSLMLKGKKFFDFKYWKSALVFAIPLIPHYLSVSILNGADKIMISKMVGDAEAGIYGLAYSISQVMTLFNTAFNQTLDPLLIKYNKNKDFESMEKTAYPTIIAIALVNILIVAIAPEIVSIFAPVEYKEAIYIIPPLAMSAFFMFFYNFFATFEFYYEKPHYVAIATTIGAFLNILLNSILLPYSYFFAAYTTLICYIIYSICHYIFMRRICSNNIKKGFCPYNTKKLLIISAIFVIVNIILICLYELTIIRYVIILLLMLFCFFNKNKIEKVYKEK